MVTIYCIEDINDLKYIGSTSQTLNRRLTQHKCESMRKNKSSSHKLNLYNCIIYSLEECEECDRKEREKYHINNIECVNTNKCNYDSKKYHKKYRKNNNEKLKKYIQEYQKNNKEKIKKYQRQYHLSHKSLNL